MAIAVRRQGIVLTVYPQLTALPQAQQMLTGEYYAAVSQAVTQNHEGARILEALSRTNMECMTLKGWDMRAHYPRPVMRQMADLDVLLRPYEYAQVVDVMGDLGYQPLSAVESSWKHDDFFRDVVTVETHKRLTDDSGAVREWESRMWDRRMPAGESGGATGTCRMAEEDVLLFHLVHMHKDFCNGSLGLRRILDTWLLSGHADSLDQALIARELEAMDLTAFAERMQWLGRVCMGEEPVDPDAELLLRHAFQHGIYGSNKSYKTARIAGMGKGSMLGGKVRSLVAAVFLPYGRMKAQFPVLEKAPVLLPVCWIRRIVELLHGNWADYRRKLDYRNEAEDDLSEMRTFLRHAAASDVSC